MTLESICPLPAVSKYTVDPKVIIFHPDYVEKVLEPLPPYGLFTLWTPLEVSEFHPLFFSLSGEPRLWDALFFSSLSLGKIVSFIISFYSII